MTGTGGKPRRRRLLGAGLVLIVALALLAAGPSLVSSLRTQGASGDGAPAIDISPLRHDFGTVPPEKVSYTFSVTNRGGGTLEILGLSTSCGCTTAEVAGDRLRAGESTDLTVTYDPAHHNRQPGQFVRQVYVRSNDPQQPEAQVEITVNVTGSAGPQPGGTASAAVSAPQATPSVLAETSPKVVVYYNRACGDCAGYIEGSLLPLLREAGWQDIVLKDYVNEPANRAELVSRSRRLGIPPALQGHFTVFVGERVILQGHVPEQVVRDVLAAPPSAFERIVLYQDKMTGAPNYRAWAFSGEVREYPPDTPISEYLEWWANAKTGEGAGRLEPAASGPALLPMVLSTGLADGLNPCAFAVLLFFIAFLVTLRSSRAGILRMGLVYIGAIYAAYFLIGLGLLRAFLIADQPHLMARVGAYLVIAVGLVNVKDWLFPGSPLSLRIPTIAHATIQDWLRKGTLPAAAIGGFLVGLCTFPCSGGIYVAILGLLSSQATHTRGLVYLALYNLMFVAPLLVLLLAGLNRGLFHRLRLLQQAQGNRLRLLGGLLMVAIGAIILIWFV